VKFSLRLVLVALAALPLSCSLLYKPLRIDEAHYPLGQLRQASIQSLPIGLRSSSSNGRELLSQYFVLKSGKYQEAINLPVRWSAKIVLLGERRPYEVEIYVFKERRMEGSQGVEYQIEGQDFRLAKRVKDQLLQKLAQRREDLNIIDDFRVF